MKAIIRLGLSVTGLALIGGCAAPAPSREARVKDYATLLGASMSHSKEVLANTSAMGKARITNAEAKNLSASTKSGLAEAQKLDFAEMLATCNTVLTRFEVRADKERRAEFWTAVAGTIAGSVVVPVLAAANAAKSAIAGWGGFAGATNSAQQMLRNTGLDAASTIAARHKVIENMTMATEEYIKAAADDVEAKQDAIARGLAACVAYEVTASKDISIDPPN
ncbi:MAG TPA: hypothetical protein PLO14_10430 [Accumulibacter sp.]|uniref:hypothetical protein n=1 Tax=Accumulibacter sp. TaxID=2053492 RepID=UPI0025CD181E|nr:hypothetical protein [Accumulibacter sp.]MCM8662628.1 hypothetical protein [Accumulibacter sp.]HNC52638.1 hypothetical protein [Accumulibacter sp.]HNG04434.1 hypothetical protein [Nitrospira sp.]